MAEMISGVPLFRGRDNNDQLNQILRILGTPDDATLRKIAQESPEIQLRPFPRLPTIPFASLLPRAHPLAIDLLEKLLKFDPNYRLSCAEALRHPYFSSGTAQQSPTYSQQPQQSPTYAQQPMMQQQQY